MTRIDLAVGFDVRFEPWRNLSHIGITCFRSATVCFVVKRRSCSRGLCGFLSEDLFTPARVLVAMSCFVFGAQLLFDLGANTCFEIRALAFFGVLSSALRFLTVEPCLYFSLTSRLFLGLKARNFFLLTPSFCFGAS